MSFQEIKFGFAAAEKEKSDSPDLLIQGFFDDYGYIREIIGMNKFLILGPKGSGKSAIGARLELLSDSNKMFFTKQYYLTSFPYKPFSSIALSTEAPETKLSINWEFILLIASLNSFIEDPTCKYRKNPKIDKVMNVLKNEGIVPSEDLAQIVKISSNKEFMASIKNVLGFQKSSQSEKIPFNIEKLFATLQNLCYSLQMEYMHYIIIDGLDDVLTQRNIQYQSLSALILAADRMNEKFKTNKINSRIIILCRTDIFDKLGGPNKNKVKRDSGIVLDWFQDVNDLKSTNLVKLVNLRAQISLGRCVDIFEEFFPNEIKGKETIKFLMECTRHTPRDVIQLLNEIQKHSKENPSKANITNAIRTYSTDYFVGEIRDELDGFLKVDEINSMIEIISLIGKSRFNMRDIDSVINNNLRFKIIDVHKCLNAFFNCNAIGNIDGPYITFKYRNRHTIFNPNLDILVHVGLRKGWNLT